MRQLTRRVGELSQEIRQRIESLSLEQLENLGEALLDFTSMADLDAWLSGLGDYAQSNKELILINCFSQG